MPVTKRDRIWKVTDRLKEATEDSTERKQLGLRDTYGLPGFTPQDVSSEIPEDVSERTIRDCLNAMVELGVLSKRGSNPSRYRVPVEER